MMGSPRRWSWSLRIALLVAVLACVAGSAFLWTDRSPADADQVPILSLIADYRRAEISEATIPADALDIVAARLDAVAQSPDRETMDEEYSPTTILPSDVREGMDKAHAWRLATYCSAAYQERHAGDVSLSDVVEAGLYNAPTDPIVVEQQYELMAVQVLENDGGKAIVWTYSWAGDVLSDGKGRQTWTVEEYRVIKEDEEWRVDARRRLVMTFPENGEQNSVETWGPLSPHYSIVYAQQEGPSELYPDQLVPRGMLQNLEEIALAQ